MNDSAKQFIFASSPVVASASSYLLNIALIYILNDPAEYAQFLSFNSFAVYLAAVAYFLIIELYIGPNRALYVLEELFSLSVIAMMISVCVISGVGIFIASTNVLLLTVAVFGFSLYRLTGQYLILSKDRLGVSRMRYIRAGLIVSAVLVLVALRDTVTLTGKAQVALQGVMCFLALVLTRFPIRKFKRIEVSKIFIIMRLDGRRLSKRLIGLLIDTAHIPLFLYLLKDVSHDLPNTYIYALGLFLPAAYVVSSLLREQALVHDELVEKCLSYRIRPYFLMVYASALLLGIVMTFFPQDISLFILGGLVVSKVAFGGAIGIVLYHKGLEFSDLILDLVILITLTLVVLQRDALGAVLVIKLAMLCLVFKYAGQMCIVLKSLWSAR